MRRKRRKKKEKKKEKVERESPARCLPIQKCI